MTFKTDAGREQFRRYWESSVDVPGPGVDDVTAMAPQAATDSLTEVRDAARPPSRSRVRRS